MAGAGASDTIVGGKTLELSEYDQVRKPHKPITDDTKIKMTTRTLAAELSCPICLDLLTQTMTTKDCLHRFCCECITTALLRGNKECPTCRKKLVSKRGLRPDKNFDALIAKIWPDRHVLEQMQTMANKRFQQQSNLAALQKSIEAGMKAQAATRRQRVQGSYDCDRKKRRPKEENGEEDADSVNGTDAGTISSDSDSDSDSSSDSSSETSDSSSSSAESSNNSPAIPNTSAQEPGPSGTSNPAAPPALTSQMPVLPPLPPQQNHMNVLRPNTPQQQAQSALLQQLQQHQAQQPVVRPIQHAQQVQPQLQQPVITPNQQALAQAQQPAPTVATTPATTAQEIPAVPPTTTLSSIPSATLPVTLATSTPAPGFCVDRMHKWLNETPNSPLVPAEDNISEANSDASEMRLEDLEFELAPAKSLLRRRGIPKPLTVHRFLGASAETTLEYVSELLNRHVRESSQKPLKIEHFYVINQNNQIRMIFMHDTLLKAFNVAKGHHLTIYFDSASPDMTKGENLFSHIVSEDGASVGGETSSTTSTDPADEPMDTSNS